MIRSAPKFRIGNSVIRGNGCGPGRVIGLEWRPHKPSYVEFLSKIDYVAGYLARGEPAEADRSLQSHYGGLYGEWYYLVLYPDLPPEEQPDWWPETSWSRFAPPGPYSLHCREWFNMLLGADQCVPEDWPVPPPLPAAGKARQLD